MEPTLINLKIPVCMCLQHWGSGGHAEWHSTERRGIGVLVGGKAKESDTPPEVKLSSCPSAASHGDLTPEKEADSAESMLSLLSPFHLDGGSIKNAFALGQKTDSRRRSADWVCGRVPKC